MLERKILQILKDATVSATIGDLPGESADAVSIMLYGNGVNTEYFGSRDNTVFNPVLKIALRNHSYEEASRLVGLIKDALHRYHDDSILSILMVGTPQYLGKNTQKRHEFQIVFNVQIKE